MTEKRSESMQQLLDATNEARGTMMEAAKAIAVDEQYGAFPATETAGTGAGRANNSHARRSLPNCALSALRDAPARLLAVPFWLLAAELTYWVSFLCRTCGNQWVYSLSGSIGSAQCVQRWTDMWEYLLSC